MKHKAGFGRPPYPLLKPFAKVGGFAPYIWLTADRVALLRFGHNLRDNSGWSENRSIIVYFSLT